MKRIDMKRILTTVLLVLTMASPLFSQNSPEQLVEKFFQDYENKGVSAAIDNLYSTNKWVERNKDAITKVKNQMLSFNDTNYIGKYYGYEKIVKKELANSFVLLSYMVKYGRQPIRFTFQFYKPNKKWKIYSFQYDGKIPEELDEASKIYFMKLKDE